MLENGPRVIPVEKNKSEKNSYETIKGVIMRNPIAIEETVKKLSLEIESALTTDDILQYLFPDNETLRKDADLIEMTGMILEKMSVEKTVKKPEIKKNTSDKIVEREELSEMDRLKNKETMSGAWGAERRHGLKKDD